MMLSMTIKRVSVFLIYYILILFVCSAQSVPDSSNYKIFYYPNGQKSSEGWMIDGQPEGWWKSYNQSGHLVSEGNRKNHQLDSAWFFYNEKGDTMLIVHYQNGLKNGERVQFLNDEYIVEKWLSDSLLSPVKTYYLSRKLKRITPYVEGKPHGFEKSFDTLGNVVEVANYYRGVLTRRERINRTDDFGYKQGNWKYFWDNGNLQMEGTYLNNKKNGFFKHYDEEGNFLSVEKFEYDKLIEDAKETKQLDRKVSYHPNGQPAIVANYYKGKAEGIRREFDTLGNVIKGYIFEAGYLRFEGITDMEGLRQGLWKEYYETGELKSEGKYKNSKRVGEWKFYFPDKTMEVVGSYSAKGKYEGEWKWYYPNHELMRVAHYEDGILEGDFVEYDMEGNIQTQGQYEEGSEEGYWYYRNGTVVEEGNFETGLRSGLWKIWYEPQKIFVEMEYQEDLLNGNYTIYYENNVIKRSGKYVKGEKNGIWRDYYDNGELFLTTLYKDGVEISWNGYKIEN